MGSIGATGLALSGGMYSLSSVSGNLPGYRALVIIHLNGGSDGHELILPLDTGYNDYAKIRPNIALKRDEITPISGRFFDRSLGINSALSPLLPSITQGRMAFLLNVGPLIKPTNAYDVLNGRATLPPFLFSHPEQTQVSQGWTGDEDQSGWLGRGIETLDASSQLKAPFLAIDSKQSTVIRGRNSRIINVDVFGSSFMGPANLTQPTSNWTQVFDSMTRYQSPTQVEAEYARTYRNVFLDNQELARADSVTQQPLGNFEDNDIARRVRRIAKLMPFYKANGATRQAFYINWGGFDTHAFQRNAGSGVPGREPLDPQLSQLAKALAAFEVSIKGAGLGNEVAVLVMSEFGRTLDEAAGNGTDHAWGNHWMVLGAGVRDGLVFGRQFPKLVLGSDEDASEQKRGYLVPDFSVDQVAADFLLWMGLPANKLTDVLPNLANFSTPRMGFLNA